MDIIANPDLELSSRDFYAKVGGPERDDRVPVFLDGVRQPEISLGSQPMGPPRVR